MAHRYRAARDCLDGTSYRIRSPWLPPMPCGVLESSGYRTRVCRGPGARAVSHPARVWFIISTLFRVTAVEQRGTFPSTSEDPGQEKGCRGPRGRPHSTAYNLWNMGSLAPLRPLAPLWFKGPCSKIASSHAFRFQWPRSLAAARLCRWEVEAGAPDLRAGVPSTCVTSVIPPKEWHGLSYLSALKCFLLSLIRDSRCLSLVPPA